MDYSKAMRIARALADMSQRELATRIEVDASLISMLEVDYENRALRRYKKSPMRSDCRFICLPFWGQSPKRQNPWDVMISSSWPNH